MLRVGDQRCLCARIAAPEQKDHWLLPFIQQPDDRVGELFPAHAVMRICLPRTDGQRGIEQQDALLCPVRQIAGAAAVVDARVVIDLLENVLVKNAPAGNIS